MRHAQRSFFVLTVNAYYAGRTPLNARWVHRRMWALSLALVALAPSALAQWTPPPGGGDVLIDGEDIGGLLDPALVQAAIDVLVEAGDANAAGLLCAWESQAVNVHILSTVRTPDVMGVADSNTIAVAPDIVEKRDVETLAMMLSHEWHHVKQDNNSPDTTGEELWPAPCQEYTAYRAQYMFMCNLMAARESASLSGDLVTKPFLCTQFESITSGLFLSLDDCLKATQGNYPNLPALPHCSNLYCDLK